MGFLINATGHSLPSASPVQTPLTPPFVLTPEEIGVQVLTHLLHIGGGYLGYGRGASMQAGWGKGGETGVGVGAGMEGVSASASASSLGAVTKVGMSGLLSSVWARLHPLLQRSSLYKYAMSMYTEGGISSAVICVPATFTALQRQAVGHIYKQAG